MVSLEDTKPSDGARDFRTFKDSNMREGWGSVWRQHRIRARLKHRLLSLAALLTAATCNDPASPSVTGIRTDSRSYVATRIGGAEVTVRLILTYSNPADTAVALDRCLSTESYPIYSVDLVLPANAEGAAYNPGWACVGGVSPIVVSPMATRVDTITLRGPTAYDNTAQRYLGVLSGIFRIRYGAQVSNDFSIEVPAGVP